MTSPDVSLTFNLRRLIWFRLVIVLPSMWAVCIFAWKGNECKGLSESALSPGNLQVTSFSDCFFKELL